jgi:D-threo-aldose 1-dehydrogenase
VEIEHTGPVASMAVEYSAPGAQRSSPSGGRAATRASLVRLGFGCVNLGSARAGRSVKADVRLVHEALDLGVRVFDTADAYGSGASERVLGRALVGRREDVTLATKGGYLFRERSLLEQSARRAVATGLRRARALRRSSSGAAAGPTGGGAYAQRDDSPRHLRAAVEGSLRRLRTDRIDVYQLHGARQAHPTLFDELVDLVTSGKVGVFGVGAESVGVAVDWLSVPAVEVVQVPFGVLDPEAARDLFPVVADRGVDVWARGVLGGGLLALAEDDPAAAGADPKAALLSALGHVARTSGLGLDALAIGFVRTFPEVATLLVGVSSSDHLRRNLELFDGPQLDHEVRAELAAIAGSVDGGAGGRT